MENPEKNSRGQRSMSAPPENRQPQQQQQETPQQGQQRYVSRVDITPQHNQQQQPPQSQQAQQPQQSQQGKPQQQSNVRHIPIFVEGRDEPVIPKNIDEASFQRQQSPPQFHTPPQFHRPSHFNDHFSGRQRQQWPPHFQDTFYNEPPHSAFDHSPSRGQQPQQPQQQPPQGYQQHQPRQQYAERQRPEQTYESPRQRQRQPPQQAPPQPTQQQQQQPQQQQQQQEVPKSKPVLPKDPLERVALVQKEVDSLAVQVKRYTGNSRKDKEYIYLDEMLTRELIKLDDIETEGRDNVRQARKNAIKTIQETISLLESKAPLVQQQQQVEEGDEAGKNDCSSSAATQQQEESMEVDQKTEQSNEAIPLPPGPSSPTKNEKVEAAEQMNGSTEAANPEERAQSDSGQVQSEQQSQQNAETLSSDIPMEIQQSPDNTVAQETDSGKQPNEDEKTEGSQESQQVADGQDKMEVDSRQKSPKSPKKVKKTKKQTPVSETAIPLPPPEGNENSAK